MLYYDLKTLDSVLSFANELLAVWHWASHFMVPNVTVQPLLLCWNEENIDS